MANIFLAVPQYKKMPESEVNRIKRELQKDMGLKYPMPTNFKGRGFHPMFDVSIGALINSKKHNIRLCVVDGDGNLPRVRSYHAAIWRKEYLHDTPCEYFMIVDDDISFSPDAIDTLIEDDKPIIGGVYTFKTKNPNYVGKVCTRFHERFKVRYDKPFRVRWLNGGFILIKAEVLLEMIRNHPELKFRTSDQEIKWAWALWLQRVYKNTFLSEDWSFCQRATEDGFQIWADLRPKIIHWNGENGFGITLPKEE